MAESELKDPLKRQARALAARLRGLAGSDDLEQGRSLLLPLRNARAFVELCELADSLGRRGAADAFVRRLYAQGLIDLGWLCPAIDMLQRLVADLPAGHAEQDEAWGLLGRAYKQMFFDSGDRTTQAARHALSHAIAAYFQPYQRDQRRNTWHGVNVLALVARARRDGLDQICPDLAVAPLATELLQALDSVPATARDPWHLATQAEAALGLALETGRMEQVEYALAEYLRHPELQAFHVASTLRQVTEVWGLAATSGDSASLAASALVARESRAVLDALRIRLLQLPGGMLDLSVSDVAHADARSGLQLPPSPAPDTGSLEAILGPTGPQTYAWWMAGLRAARSVGVIRRRLGKRVGTGFVVTAASVGWPSANPEERLVLTNYHVVNAAGESPGIRPEHAEIVFEAHSPAEGHPVTALLWSSAVGLHDAALLRVDNLPPEIEPLPVTDALPPMPVADGVATPRVYIIGHPGGRELSFSFQDNELLDHEGPPSGRPQIAGVCRVHYKAPTEGGSSGSPVFEQGAWQVVALHHKGGRIGMSRLNGGRGSYAANEGISLSTIAAAIRECALGEESVPLAPAGQSLQAKAAVTPLDPPDRYR